MPYVSSVLSPGARPTNPGRYANSERTHSDSQMSERLKLRHKIKGAEEGPFWGLLEANLWVPLFSTREYDYIRSSDCYDKNGTQIFEGDMVTYIDGWPIQVIDNVGRVGFDDAGTFVRLSQEFCDFCEVVGRDGVVFNW